MKIILHGNPVSTGNLYKTMCRGNFPCTYMTKRGSDMKRDYQNAARQLYKGKPITGSIAISVDVYLGTKRKADWDNFHKISMDALTGVVWQDDSQIIEAHVYKRYDKQNPRIEITLLEPAK